MAATRHAFATVAELQALSPRARVRSYQADFAQLGAVRGLADEITAHEPQLDVLINNAGIGIDGPRAVSADGHELRLAVNYLASFVLTARLRPLLAKSRPARIVNVSSAGQRALEWSNLMLEHDYSGGRAYCQSKLAQILFTFELAPELEAEGITITALHPATYMPTKMVPNPISPLQEGIDATIRLAVAPEVEGLTGRYFDGQGEARASAQAYDTDARRRLREWSERQLGS
jgi:NAD(P)-dependent dehydrogenase (short-subunit alcohol dehydrogenase family)